MNLLLDTCALLWFLSNDAKLTPSAMTAIQAGGNNRWISPISLLEIAIKVRTGKLPLNRPFASIFPTELLKNDIHLLPLEIAHIEPLTTMPLHHRDPFDRIIATTALVEAMTLVSSDPVFDAYGITRLW